MSIKFSEIRAAIAERNRRGIRMPSRRFSVKSAATDAEQLEILKRRQERLPEILAKRGIYLCEKNQERS
jgi:hypothetical protein